jgi:zinc transporter 2
LNIRAAFIHVLGDLVQSIGVLIAAIIIKFSGFSLADPICTFVFAVLVLVSFFKLRMKFLRENLILGENLISKNVRNFFDYLKKLVSKNLHKF